MVRLRVLKLITRVVGRILRIVHTDARVHHLILGRIPNLERVIVALIHVTYPSCDGLVQNRIGLGLSEAVRGVSCLPLRSIIRSMRRRVL